MTHGRGDAASRHRFYAPPQARSGDLIQLPDEASEQVCRVLRMAPGDSVALFDDTRAEYDAVLGFVTAESVTAEITACRQPGVEPAVRVSVYQAIIRPEPFELVLQKGTELGASAFAPLVTARVQGGPAAAPSTGRMARW